VGAAVASTDVPPVATLDGEQLIGDDIEAAANAEGEDVVAEAASNPRSVLSDAQRAALRAIAGPRARFDEPMRRHTTLKMGGPADALVEPGSVDEIAAVCRWAAANAVAITVIGGGSNLLVRDGGVRGLVLGTRNLRGLTIVDGTRVRVEAGVSTGKVLS